MCVRGRIGRAKKEERSQARVRRRERRLLVADDNAAVDGDSKRRYSRQSGRHREDAPYGRRRGQKQWSRHVPWGWIHTHVSRWWRATKWCRRRVIVWDIVLPHSIYFLPFVTFNDLIGGEFARFAIFASFKFDESPDPFVSRGMWCDKDVASVVQMSLEVAVKYDDYLEKRALTCMKILIVHRILFFFFLIYLFLLNDKYFV